MDVLSGMRFIQKDTVEYPRNRPTLEAKAIYKNLVLSLSAKVSSCAFQLPVVPYHFHVRESDTSLHTTPNATWIFL